MFKLLKRHSDELDATLEAICFDPMVKISKRKLRYVYGMERLSKNVWKDVFERLPNWPGIDKIYYIEDDDDIYIIKKFHCQEAAKLLE